MSLEYAIKTLMSLGLTQMDTQVYVYLAKMGPRKEKDLANALKINKNQLCFSIENLVAKGMVSISFERSEKYSAVALEKVLNDFMKQTKQQAKTLKTRRTELISTWHSIIEDCSST